MGLWSQGWRDIAGVGSRKLLLVLASTVILGSESRGTHEHVLLSHGSWESCSSSGWIVYVLQFADFFSTLLSLNEN
jgi:hypothetical protein